MRRQLVTVWRADAAYSVEALADVSDALIGFPVPTWGFQYYTPEGLDEADLPAVTRFATFVDGVRVAGVRMTTLEVPDPPFDGSGGTTKTVGYVWRVSFRKGERRTLRTTYEFGEDTSNAFYSGYQYDGPEPWFLPGWEGRRPAARQLHYFLTPIRTWAEPPPEEIRIRVDLPKDHPVTVFVPFRVKPSCVDEHALHFSLAKTFPDADLSISYPAKVVGIPRLETPAQWSSWRAMVGGDAARLTCRLRDRLAKGAGGPLRSILRNARCVARCEGAGS